MEIIIYIMGNCYSLRKLLSINRIAALAVKVALN